MIIQINVVMDFVGGYHSKLVNDFINLFGERRTVANGLSEVGLVPKLRAN